MRVALAYAILSAAWIAFSDQAVVWLVSDPGTIAGLNTIKGLAFVVVTGTLLYTVLVYQLRAWQAEAARRRTLEAVHDSALAIAHADLRDSELSELQVQIAGLAGKLAGARNASLALDEQAPGRDDGTELGVAVPLHEQYAVLHVASPAGKPRFTDVDREAITLLGEHAAVAIENARLRARLRASIAAREQVLAAVAHDLRNPLGSIAIEAKLLERRHPNDDVGASARSAQRAIAAMNRLIAELLDVERLDGGALALDLAAHALRPTIEEVVAASRAAAEDREIAIDVDVPTLMVCADGDRVARVLFNLIGNAIKFTPSGGRITVCATGDNREVQVTVADSGKGIAAEDLPRVFDRNFTRDGGRGVGLGLFIARSIITAHGGRLWVESEPGHGARFSFTLPAATPADDGN